MEYLLYLLLNLIFTNMPKDEKPKEEEVKKPRPSEVSTNSDESELPSDPPPGKPDIKP